MKVGADSIQIQTFKAKNVANKIAMFDLPKIGKISQYKIFKELELSDDGKKNEKLSEETKRKISFANEGKVRSKQILNNQ